MKTEKHKDKCLGWFIILIDYCTPDKINLFFTVNVNFLIVVLCFLHLRLTPFFLQLTLAVSFSQRSIFLPSHLLGSVPFPHAVKYHSISWNYFARSLGSCITCLQDCWIRVAFQLVEQILLNCGVWFNARYYSSVAQMAKIRKHSFDQQLLLEPMRTYTLFLNLGNVILPH